jgi:tRNA (mo5U34)-methyltransferase
VSRSGSSAPERPEYPAAPPESDRTSAPPAGLHVALRSLTWYHTVEIVPGVVTPGLVDCRGIVDRIPWPESLAGLRCLDVGTHDGFWAFELEARGASEVVAIDLDDPTHRDWTAGTRTQGPGNLKGRGWAPAAAFHLVAEARGSRVQRRSLSVYDVTPGAVGMFDVVFVGSLLLHLRDPLRALQALRSVTRRWLLVSDVIDAALELAVPRTAAARVDGVAGGQQWWLPNRAGLARMVEASEFRVVALSRPFILPPGRQRPFGMSGWVKRGRPWHRARERLRHLLVTGSPATGAPHVALRAEPS